MCTALIHWVLDQIKVTSQIHYSTWLISKINQPVPAFGYIRVSRYREGKCEGTNQ